MSVYNIRAYIVVPHLSYYVETVLMSGHNMTLLRRGRRRLRIAVIRKSYHY